MANANTQEIHKLYKLSLDMADLAEDILESRGEYSDEFLSSLKKSLADEKTGKVRKINSLSDLA
jgi:hypothetical protein